MKLRRKLAHYMYILTEDTRCDIQSNNENSKKKMSLSVIIINIER